MTATLPRHRASRRASARRMRRGASWAVSIVMLIAAWFVVDATPELHQIQAPFPVSAPPGEWATGRGLSVRIESAHLSDTVQTIESRFTGTATTPTVTWRASGNWLVLTIDAMLTESDLVFGPRYAVVTIDGVSYDVSTRPPINYLVPDDQGYIVGLGRRNTLVVELPETVRAGDAVLRMSLENQAPDSVLVLPFTLDDQPRQSVTDIRPATWSNP